MISLNALSRNFTQTYYEASKYDFNHVLTGFFASRMTDKNSSPCSYLLSAENTFIITIISETSICHKCFCLLIFTV